MKFKRCIGVIVTVMWENIQEFAHIIERLASDVRNQEDGTYTLTDELSLQELLETAMRPMLTMHDLRRL